METMSFVAPHQYDLINKMLHTMTSLSLADEDIFDHVSFKLGCIHLDGKIIFYVKHR